MNKFEIIGRLTNEPETRFTTEGKGITTFTMAVNTTKDDTTFIKVTTFGATSELIQKYTHKGDMILVDGNIKNNNYTDKDGNKHFEYTFVGNRIEFLSRASKSSSEQKSAKKEPKNELDDKVFEEFGKSIEISEDELAF